VFPLEASGTSGMKAGFNGVINLSVLDGWWGEGYDGRNGWAIKPASELLSEERRNIEEGRSLYELLQDKVIPLYYARGQSGFSPEWIQMAKRSIMTLLPRYNSERMVGEYLDRFYIPAAQRGRQFAGDGYAVAREVAGWKRRVRASWREVAIRHLALPERDTRFGEGLRFEVGVRLPGLAPGDVVVELLLSPTMRGSGNRAPSSFALRPGDIIGDGPEHRFALEISPDLCGKLEYRIRVYPSHPALSHRFEMGLMKWV
jgi:starch phosphorylase